jgi:hypothetical protein
MVMIKTKTPVMKLDETDQMKEQPPDRAYEQIAPAARVERTCRR